MSSRFSSRKISGTFRTGRNHRNRNDEKGMLMPDNVSECIDFIEEVVSRYEWEPSVSGTLQNEIARISEKRNDPKLYLGVIGEFTTGKSTFINALLRKDLLKTSSTSETTCSATLIQYGPTQTVEVLLNEDRVHRLEEEDGADFSHRFQHFLQRYSAQEEYAQEVREVRVFLPSTILEKGLVIVDTPGTDITNPRHREVTECAIRYLCDAFVVVISAQKQISKTQTDFIKNNLSNILDRCIFIVTMMDLIDEDERDKVLHYIKHQLTSTFGITNPIIFPVAPVFISENHTIKNQDAQQSDAFVTSFVTTEEHIFRILQENREQILREKLSLLLMRLLSDLDNHLSDLDRKYTTYHASLMNNRVENLDHFINGEKASHLSSVSWPVTKSTTQLQDRIDDSFDQLLNSTISQIQAAKDISVLRKSIPQLTTQMNEQIQKDIQVGIQEFSNEIDNIYTSELKIFESEFQKMYRSLSTLGGFSADHDVKITSLDTVSQEIFTYSNKLKEALEKVEESDNSFLKGGAIGGAIIGTIAIPIPILGTLIGGFCGLIAGAFASGDLETEKKKYISTLSESALSSKKTIKDLINQHAAQYNESKKNEFIQSVDSYFLQYDSLVRKMVQHDKQELHNLENLKEIISCDHQEIVNRQQILSGGTTDGTI